MIKYLLVGMTAYMIFAGLFSINFEGDNIGIGFNCFHNAATGHHNIAIGVDAGAAVSSGEDNILIGNPAGTAVSTATRNVFIGMQSGHDLSTGDGGNTGIGVACMDIRL